MIDIQRVFISTAAIFGIGVIWFNFNKKVFTTVCRLVGAPFFSREWPQCDGCFVEYDVSENFQSANICALEKTQVEELFMSYLKRVCFEAGIIEDLRTPLEGL